jgi:flagellar protein FliS
VPTNSAQLRYLTDAVSTATPARLAVMLYDRLGLDLRRAAEAQSGDEPFSASTHLLHAQQIVTELMTSLRLDLWPEGEGLASLYGFLLTELIAVNGAPDPARLAAVTRIVSELRESWSAAGDALLNDAASTPPRPGTEAMAWVG